MGPVAPDMNQADAALVISPWLEGWFLPALFAAAGMPCDLVSACPVFRQSQRLRRLDLVSSAADLAPRALHLWRQHGPYAWVIACSDALLGELAQRALLDSAYRSLLPLMPLASTAHLHAKIGLSRAFTSAGIPTPAWRVARDPASALQQAPALGWPLLLKQDASAGGRGLWLCQNPEELSQAVQIQAGRPFLLQQWRDGRLYSVEALYRQGTLQAFALSEVLAGVGRYGPSTQRCYGLSVDRIPELEVHLERIGTALGLHGFTNISLIHAGGAEPAQFIECDVRPNAWIHLDRALGGDFARALQACSASEADSNKASAAETGFSPAVAPAIGKPAATSSRACYQFGASRILAPFHQPQLGSVPRPSSSQGQASETWPYPPPDDAPSFLAAVLASGQLDRITSLPKDS
jgi:hypothetical protein